MYRTHGSLLGYIQGRGLYCSLKVADAVLGSAWKQEMVLVVWGLRWLDAWSLLDATKFFFRLSRLVMDYESVLDTQDWS